MGQGLSSTARGSSTELGALRAGAAPMRRQRHAAVGSNSGVPEGATCNARPSHHTGTNALARRPSRSSSIMQAHVPSQGSPTAGVGSPRVQTGGHSGHVDRRPSRRT